MPQADVLQRLYDAEINFTISTLWDCGFHWKLGDGLNGYVAEGCATTFDEAVAQIIQAALHHLPDSEFAHCTAIHGSRTPDRGTPPPTR